MHLLLKVSKALSSFSQMINDELKMEIPFTWFIRIDDQIKYFFGDRFYLVDKVPRQFLGKASLMQRHELAWHPHIYEEKGKWIYNSNKYGFLY